MSDPSIKVRIPRSPFPVTITLTAPNKWSLSETFADQQVGHGHLVFQDGQFTIIATDDSQKRHYQSWRRALIDQLRHG